MSLQRIMVLNRGEIACRIIQAIQEMGKTAITVYSDVDANARHVQLADEAYPLPGTSATETYLNFALLLKIAATQNVEAVHPGYGFLSERSVAAKSFTDAGVKWIGPSAEAIEKLGNKLSAKRLLDKAKVPSLPWAEVNLSNLDLAASKAKEIAYPLLLKAAAGGGGKGMRLVHTSEDLEAGIQAAASEGKNFFGDPTVFMEKFIKRPRHVEVQIIGDEQGMIYDLGERDCSAQRRHQKIIEESPAPNFSNASRLAIAKAACDLAKSVGYASAGTIEFLVDEDENFYFLELNSRLQVEHCVTEQVWGVDLVKAQISISEGKSCKDIFGPREAMHARGHSIEMRIYAEDPRNEFMPAPGKIIRLKWPSGTGIRIETGICEGDEVGLDYDPMIAKLVVTAPNRKAAIDRSIWALQHTVVFGVTTNINYLQDILTHEAFRKKGMYVKFLENEFSPWEDPLPDYILENEVEIRRSADIAGASNGNSKVGMNADVETNAYASPWELR